MYIILLFLVFVSIPVVVYFTVNGSFREIYEKKPKYDYPTQRKFLDESLWVKKVIESCNNRKQIWSANELLQIFKRKYVYKVERTLYRKVCDNLEAVWDAVENKCFLLETRTLNERKIRKRS